MAEKPCYKCAGSGVTEKTEHTVVTDEKGVQTPQKHQFTSPCSACGGSGKVYS